MEQNLSIEEKERIERRKINVIIRSIIYITGELSLIVLSFIELPIFREGVSQANRWYPREEGYAKFVKDFSLFTKFDLEGDMYIVCIFVGFLVLSVAITLMGLFTKNKKITFISNFLFFICSFAFLVLCVIGFIFYRYY